MMERVRKLSGHIVVNNNTNTINNGNEVVFNNDMIYECIVSGVMNDMNVRVFPCMTLSLSSSLYDDRNRMLTLSKVQRLPFTIAIVQLLSDAQLSPSVGFNPGTGTITFVIEYPKVAPSSLNVRQCVLWMMLGLHSEQLAFESRWESDPVNNTSMSLANVCLRRFATDTLVGLQSRHVLFSHARLSLVFVDAQRGNTRLKDNALFGDDMTPLYEYSPSYARITGFDARDPLGFSEEIQLRQRHHLATSIMQCFWSLISKRRYLPDTGLRAHVQGTMHKYFAQNTASQMNEFRPVTANSLMMFLYGLPGTGKSTFVTHFRDSLYHAIHTFLERGKRVDVVRVPLNNISPGDLRRIVHVRGISDWSIERIAEQTISRGGIVLLHIEEVPQDHALQEAHFDVLRSLLSSLAARYPEYGSNCIIVFTSNYTACQCIRDVAACIEVCPPSEEDQRRWCSLVLEDIVREMVPHVQVVKVKMIGGPQVTKDMRRLESWRVSVGFFVARHVATTHDHSSNVELHVETRTDGQLIVHVGANKSDDRALVLHTADGFFYSKSASDWHDSTMLANCEYVPRNDISLVQSLIDMYKQNYLRPAVIVLVGCSQARQCVAKAIHEAVHSRLRECTVNDHEFTVMTDTDCESVFGHPDRLSGTLFRAIDESNNPIHGTNRYAFIVIHANLVGQFMLRDTLQDNSTTSHVTQLHKDRLMFIVSVDESAEVSPQLRSRAQCIINCDRN